LESAFFLALLANYHQALGLAVRKRLQQHRIYHAEQGRVGANAESQSANSPQEKAGALPQGSRRVAQVLAQCGEHTKTNVSHYSSSSGTSSSRVHDIKCGPTTCGARFSVPRRDSSRRIGLEAFGTPSAGTSAGGTLQRASACATSTRMSSIPGPVTSRNR